MFDKLTVIDVETPSARNDRICSIGITEIVNGEIIETRNFFVNPECDFDSKNIAIHGIHPEDVENAATFADLWPEIRSSFIDSVVVAYNAIFDLSVLRKTLLHYSIEESTINYLDALPAARRTYEGLENYKLDTVCKHHSICLNHHDSGSDCSACAQILCDMLSKNALSDDDIQYFDLSTENEPEYRTGFKFKISKQSKALNELKSILREISYDCLLDKYEMIFLISWINEHEELAGNYPYDIILCTLRNVLADGVIDQEEVNELIKLFDELEDPVESKCVCCNTNDIKGKNICLSGEFECGSKSDISKKLVDMGAIMQNSVTKTTDIVLVGGLGSDAWVGGNYGKKIKKAIEMQQKGSSIIIIKEKDLFC